MSYSVRHGKQVVVLSPQLLSIGGLLNAEPRPGDVAKQVLNRLRSIANDAEIPGPDVTKLTRIRFKANSVVVRPFGLKPAEEQRDGA